MSVAGVASIQFTVALDDPLAQLRKVLVAPKQIVVSVPIEGGAVIALQS